MKKLATRLTPAIKAWIKEEFGSNHYDDYVGDDLFHFPNLSNNNGFIPNNHLYSLKSNDYTEVSEQEFLAEFGKPKPIIQYYNGEYWIDCMYQDQVRIKPTPDYSKEIEALQNKAKENGMKVTINFEKL